MKKKILWIEIIVIVVLICMAISTIEGSKTGIVSDMAGIVAKPFQKLFVGIDNVLDYGFDYFQDMDELKKQNAMLKSQVVLLKEEVAKNDGIKSENDRLRALIDLGEKRQNFDMVGALVIAIEPTGWFPHFIIDKGTADGIKKNCVVLDADGVLGRVEEVGASWARVITIIEPGTACGAEISRTGDTGIIEGDSQLIDMCKMTALPKDSSIMPGDYIITSGSGDVYPYGLTVGRVKEVTGDELSKTAIVEPAANVKSPKEVMVIKEVYPTGYGE